MEKTFKYLLSFTVVVNILLSPGQSQPVKERSTDSVTVIKLSDAELNSFTFWRDTLGNDSVMGQMFPATANRQYDTLNNEVLYNIGTPRADDSHRWRIIIIFAVLIALAFSRFLFPGLVFVYTKAFVRRKALQELFEEQKSEIGTFSIWMIVVSSALYAFPIQFLAWQFGIRITDYAWGDYMFIAIGLFTFFVVKFFLEIGLARIIEANSLAASLVFSSAYVHFIGALLLLPVFMYVQLNNWTFDAESTAILLGIILGTLILVRLARAIAQAAGEAQTPFFYIILYLCALEVAPWLVIYRLLEINLN